MSDASSSEMISCTLQIVNATTQTLATRSTNGDLTYWSFRPVPPVSTAFETIEFSDDRANVSADAAFYTNNTNYAFYLQALTNTKEQEYYLQISPPTSGRPYIDNVVMVLNGGGTITKPGKFDNLLWLPWSGVVSTTQFAYLTKNNMSFGLALVDLNVVYPESPEAATDMFNAIKNKTLTAQAKLSLYNALMDLVALRGDQWMTQTWDTIAKKPLSSVCLPGSHDSGTAVSINPSKGSTLCNTQTQSLDILGQLNAGVRFFDFRPCYPASGGEPYLTHFRTIAGVGTWGALGQTLQNALGNVLSFIQQPCGQNEIIVLKFSHMAALGAKPGPMSSTQFQNIVNMVQGMLKSYLYYSSNTTINLNQTNLIGLTRPPGPTVIALFDVGYSGAEGYFFPKDLIDPAKGIFAYGDTNVSNVSYPIMPNFLLFDSYSNSNIFSTMVADQKAKLAAFKPNATQSFLLSWTLTCQSMNCTGGVVGKKTGIGCIINMARAANPLLSGTVFNWVNDETITTGRMPNILYVDFCGEFADESMAVAAELNARF